MSESNINKIILLNDLLQEEIKNYSGLTTSELQEKFNIALKSKNINYVIFQKIIANSKNSFVINDLLKECSCVIKTINLEWNDTLKESMSLRAFKYCEIVNESWNQSTLRNYFNDNIFIFVIFKKDFNDSILENIKVWKMPNEILDNDVKEVWIKTQTLIKEGKIVNYIDNKGRYITYFPTSGETKYVHVRPHAQSASDTYPLPVNDKQTNKNSFVKHSFWINSHFIRKIVVEGKYYA